MIYLPLYDVWDVWYDDNDLHGIYDVQYLTIEI